jgi:hypothetical protein
MVLELGAGPEEAVPATKTFSAQIVALALIAEGLGAVPWTGSDWERMRAHVEQGLADETPAPRSGGNRGCGGTLSAWAAVFSTVLRWRRRSS